MSRAGWLRVGLGLAIGAASAGFAALAFAPTQPARATARLAVATPPAEALSAGSATIFDDTRAAFSQPVPTLDPKHRASFFVGNSFFNENWVQAPASIESRDGLGPLFNARSCSSCHFKDGRSRPPDPGLPLSTMLVRVSLPGTKVGEALRPHPVYGDQIQGQAVPGARAEADVLVEYHEQKGHFGDGDAFSLRRPRYHLTHVGYGPVAKRLLVSPRVAPIMVGLGLLEAISDRELEAAADPDDRDADGISGRLARVPDSSNGQLAIGRFGWKAEQPSVAQQTAAAFLGDMGLTSRGFPHENHSPRQRQAARQPSGGSPEISDEILNAVVLYARTLGVPARRTTGGGDLQRGRELFETAGCGICHRSTWTTGASFGLPELAGQEIHPYTDLLLHDLGSGLSDERPTFAADGVEWRTPPLWGLGLVPRVNGHSFLLHDGRARNVAEAILWHGGEAQRARDAFARMPRGDRGDLIAFVGSL